MTALIFAIFTLAPEVSTPEVLATYLHDTSAYTQGLLYHEGWLYESTGQYGASSLRKVNPTTGEVVQRHNLDAGFFAEGLARVDNTLIQLTWQEGTAIVYNLQTFDEIRRHSYSGQGWGLCFDGTRLVMSDGSSRLTFRDPQSFAVTGGVDVALDSEPLANLNELECGQGWIFANVYWTRSIVEILPHSGEVVRVYNAVDLLTPTEEQSADVLNGVAYNNTDDTFFITGKLWPKLFAVRMGDHTEETEPEPEPEPEPEKTPTVAQSQCASTSPMTLATLIILAAATRRRRVRQMSFACAACCTRLQPHNNKPQGETHVGF